ncbi:heavy metal translocating P-type ATPase [Psychrosphaera sp. 1_MG-2023]|uniref:heavy metal translocating P-type ATPase n=1 Tax=Psychrosphaera sp. 1_MG-2023 TaxID=3062643 RepID=UPI0026E1764A|nr:heavy metal translocating P-type ATPase [Psychrosphaera sp. 1_MG-2023]MDO6718008.1 heavy metal translocating P-type ATPase [Psychrosphaera sp. 1_MG-2023]
MTKKTACFHCGESIPAGESPLFAQLNTEQQQVCCNGCKAVSEHIYQSGLSVYYQYRTELGNKPDTSDSSDFEVYNQAEYIDLICENLQESTKRITLSVDNIHCAACAWLIEHSLSPLDGIIKVNVNTISERATIEWDQNIIHLSQLLSKLKSIGYASTPFSVTDAEKNIKRQEKQYIKRLGVAGLFTMQVMMLAFAMYFGAFSTMESHQTSYFKWISFALCIPVVFYSALPFLRGAITAVKSRHLSMDVSVAVAIYGAFFISFYQLLKYGFDGNRGEVYFESISMFTLLLLIGKYLEFKAKSRAILSNANLNKTLPIFANRFENGQITTVLIQKLNIGDTIVVKPGEQFAVDGKIVNGETTVNESVLTGEFSPIFKHFGDPVLAGSINNDGNIKVEITALGSNTTLAKIGQLQEEFTKHRPKLSQFADKIAHYFVIGQLIIAFITYLIWLNVSPDDAIWISLSVLVATCPCALSLATPTAYTCILSKLNRKGILVKDALAFEQLTEITHVAFDKTGTLTTGRFEINANGTELSSEFTTELAAAVYLLQCHSEHPIAKAFTTENLGILNRDIGTINLTDIVSHIGQGISATYNEKTLKIGTPEFIGSTLHLPKNRTVQNVLVSYDNRLCAQFSVTDNLKPDSEITISNLKQKGLTTLLVTGDPSESGNVIGKKLNFDHIYTGCDPKSKADKIVSLQSEGNNILMIGDGINDAPVFGASNVSIAMSSGADMTKHSADIIVLNNKLTAVETLLTAALETKQTIRNNLYWSLIYNMIILPVAMLGLVPPYIAVLGMSASSILVVSNSLKLLRD